MKVIHILASIFCVIALLAVMLISSVDIAVYGNKGYFQKEYQKYDVLKNINMNEINIKSSFLNKKKQKKKKKYKYKRIVRIVYLSG